MFAQKKILNILDFNINKKYFSTYLDTSLCNSKTYSRVFPTIYGFLNRIMPVHTYKNTFSSIKKKLQEKFCLFFLKILPIYLLSPYYYFDPISQIDFAKQIFFIGNWDLKKTFSVILTKI